LSVKSESLEVNLSGNSFRHEIMDMDLNRNQSNNQLFQRCPSQPASFNTTEITKLNTEGKFAYES